MSRVMRHWKVLLLTAVVAVAALAIGGPYVYANFIAEDAPPPLSVALPSAGAVTTGDTAAVTADGTWKVSSGSQAGYRVKEVLNGQRVEAVGRTGDVTGTITIDSQSVTAGSFTVDLRTVASDSSMRDNQFRGRIMETSQYPDATLKLSDAMQLPSIPAVGAQVTGKATGELTLHGVTKPVSFDVTAARTGAASFDIAAAIPVVFADYSIANPSFAPMVTTEDSGVIEVLLKFTKG